MILQTIIIWSNLSHSLKYLRSPTLKCKDIRIRKLEFVTKTQFLSRCKIILIFVLILDQGPASKCICFLFLLVISIFLRILHKNYFQVYNINKFNNKVVISLCRFFNFSRMENTHWVNRHETRLKETLIE